MLTWIEDGPAVNLEPFFLCYIALWVLACVAAAVIFVAKRRSFELSYPDYRRFLIEPWKVATFVAAATGITVIAPYTGDPTWDYVDALFMSILTFSSAPWAVGVLFLWMRRRAPFYHAYVALCLWMFSASWSYDIYLVFRDGTYPVTWFSNIFASSVLYLSAGLLWNLQWQHGRGVIFAFMAEGWPRPSPAGQFARLVWVALPFMLIAAVAVLSFVWPSG